MAALVAVMIVVAATTFDWRSVLPRTVRRLPASETVVMALTSIITAVTGNLAYGVIAGIALSIVAFARHAERSTGIDVAADDGSSRTYRIFGQVFFASSQDLIEKFDYDNDPDTVVIDLSSAQIWDSTSKAALDTVQSRYRHRGKTAVFVHRQPAALGSAAP
jgi:SulP family sulfate permease